jgi:hypothetical protein
MTRERSRHVGYEDVAFRWVLIKYESWWGMHGKEMTEILYVLFTCADMRTVRGYPHIPHLTVARCPQEVRRKIHMRREGERYIGIITGLGESVAGIKRTCHYLGSLLQRVFFEKGGLSFGPFNEESAMTGII